ERRRGGRERALLGVQQPLRLGELALDVDDALASRRVEREELVALHLLFQNARLQELHGLVLLAPHFLRERLGLVLQLLLERRDPRGGGRAVDSNRFERDGDLREARLPEGALLGRRFEPLALEELAARRLGGLQPVAQEAPLLLEERGCLAELS